MNSKLRYSDLMTTTRILAVGVFALVVSMNPTLLGLWPGLVILGLIFLTDGLDGQIARRFDGESKFGAFYDIVGDRVAETVLLIPFVFLQIAHPIVLIYFVTKDFLVDYKRMTTFIESEDVPFKQVKGPIAEFLTASRPMRFFYAVIKLVMIALFYVLIFDSRPELVSLASVIAMVTVITSLLRTIPSFVSVKI